MISPSQSASILARHATEIASLRLLELCHDEDRVDSMVEVLNGEDGRSLLVDFSRQRMTLDTVMHLLRLAAALHLRERIKDLAHGRLGLQSSRSLNSWEGPMSPTVSFAGDGMKHTHHDCKGSMHLSLRMPVGCFVSTKSGKNALDPIHSEWKRIQSLSTDVRDGNVRNSAPMVDVLVIGGAVVRAALEFVYNALSHDKGRELHQSNNHSSDHSAKNNVESIIQIVKTPFKAIDGVSSSIAKRRRLRFLNSIDNSAFREATSELAPNTTCVITLDLDEENEEQCQTITMMVQQWLLGGNTTEAAADVIKKQMYLVTTKEKKHESNPNNTFLIPHHSSYEAFSTFSVAGLLPLSIMFGWDVVSDFLSGAHSLDRHFVETSPRRNLAVLLGLIDIWNDAYQGMHGKVMTPCLQGLGKYSAFVSILENIVLCGKTVDDWSLKKNSKGVPSPVIDGLNGNYYRDRVSTEFITAMEPSELMSKISFDAVTNNNNDRIFNMLQRADMLAFGSWEFQGNNNMYVTSPGSPPAIQSCDSTVSVSSAMNSLSCQTNNLRNLPSTLIICEKCDAYVCGQLLALAEHRVLVKAWMWGIDPFEKQKHNIRFENFKEGLTQMYQDLTISGTFNENEIDDQKADSGVASMIGSTRTILSHYAIQP